MSNFIKNLVNTGGWKQIEEMFVKAIKECKDPSDISTELDDKTYAREVRARVIASNAMKQLVNNIKLAGAGDPVNKISYK